jgi:anti-anti-sigma factor
MQSETTTSAGVLQLSGDLDLASAAATARRVRRYLGQLPAGADPIIDLSAVTFLDSQGIHALVRASEEHGGPVQLRGVPPLILRTLELAGLESVFALPE